MTPSEQGQPKMWLFSYGFRPFFLLGALWVPVVLATLLAGFAFGLWPASAPPLFAWHGHELLFGFVMAAIAGFLLTAVPTWTSTRPVSGWPLLGLVALWVAGRVVMYPGVGLDPAYAAAIELSFVPALMVALAAPLVRTRNLRNYPFLVMLALLLAVNFLFHGHALGWLSAPPFDPLRVAADIIMLMIVVVGGRIVPLFTRNALAASGKQSSIAPAPRLEAAAVAAVVAVAVGDLAVPDTRIAGAFAAVAGVLLAARLARWEGLRTVRMPIVFVLHVGYGWVVVALALKAVFLLGQVTWAANWFHALTAGAFGTMILAVTTRVALGHTGRPLVVSRPIVVAYGLVALGAALRVFGPWVLPFEYVHVVASAMVVWSAAYLLFLSVYLPALLGPRADVVPGERRPT
jgi:uncharacterized protein involved in response to NO